MRSSQPAGKVTLCNYISGEVLRALRQVNSLVLTAHLGERWGWGWGVLANVISRVGKLRHL